MLTRPQERLMPLTATGKLDTLIDGAEELLMRLADAHHPDVQRLRDRIDLAIVDARNALGGGASRSVRLRDIVRTVDDYVRDHPWLALVTGILVAGSAGFIAGSVLDSKKGLIR
ncbi:MAG: hypothetical protein NVSMB10_13850 [Steroidobacteraceae bacterium]